MGRCICISASGQVYTYLCKWACIDVSLHVGRYRCILAPNACSDAQMCLLRNWGKEKLRVHIQMLVYAHSKLWPDLPA